MCGKCGEGCCLVTRRATVARDRYIRPFTSDAPKKLPGNATIATHEFSESAQHSCLSKTCVAYSEQQHASATAQRAVPRSMTPSSRLTAPSSTRLGDLVIIPTWYISVSRRVGVNATITKTKATATETHDSRILDRYNPVDDKRADYT